MVQEFEFYYPGRIIFGIGARENLRDKLIEADLHRAFIVTDKTIVKVGIVDKVLEALEKGGGISCRVFDEVVENPLSSIVDAGYALAKDFDAESIIGIGGGSALDTAKGIAMLMTNGGGSIDYFKGSEVKNPSLHCVLMPTTSGTGSEVNRCFVVTDPSNKFKDGVAHDLMCPSLSILDPELGSTMPPRVTASTGIDAFTHAFEGFLSRNAHPLSDALNLHAMRLISRNIRRAFADPSDMEARSAMMLASAIAGIGFDQIGLVLAHAMAHPLSGLFNVPHGVACGVVTAPVMEFNSLAVPEKILETGRILGLNPSDSTDECRRLELVADGFRRLLSDLRLPTSLSQLGIGEGDLEKLTDDAFASVGMRGRNPRVNSREDIFELYRKIL